MPFIAANAYASHWSVFCIADRKGAGRKRGIYLEKLGTDILPSAGDSYGTVRRGRSAAAPTLFVSVAIFQGFLDLQHYVITHLQEYKPYHCPIAHCNGASSKRQSSAFSPAEVEDTVK